MEFWNFFTHIIGAVLALYLFYKVIHIRLREFIFSVCMCICLSFSSAYHFYLFMGSDDIFIRKLDHCGIFLLIAGTSTAIFRSKIATLLLWGWTFGSIMSIVYNPVLSTSVLTFFYLLFGWGCTTWAIKERWLTWDTLFIAAGSGIMSSGSLINLYDYRIGHIVFHMLTLIGSLFYVKLIFNLKDIQFETRDQRGS